MRFQSVATALTAMVLCSTAALATPVASSKVLATVGNVSITERDLDTAIASYPPQQRAYFDKTDGRRAILNELVSFNLLALSGKEQKLDQTPAYKEAMALHERQILANLAGEKAIAGAGDAISPAEIKNYYEEHKAAFVTPAAIRASHILFSLPKGASDKDVQAIKTKALGVIKQIQSGKITFDQAAKDDSSCPSKAQGGDLGFFTKGQMVPAFEKAAFALKVGQMTTEPVRTEFGFHIIKVTDERPAKTMSLDEVKDSVKNLLASQAKMAAFQKTIGELKVKFPVKIVDPALQETTPTVDKQATPAKN